MYTGNASPIGWLDDLNLVFRPIASVATGRVCGSKRGKVWEERGKSVGRAWEERGKKRCTNTGGVRGVPPPVVLGVVEKICVVLGGGEKKSETSVRNSHEPVKSWTATKIVW